MSAIPAIPWDALVTFIYAPDLEAATAFYSGVAGLPLALDQGSCRIFRVTSGAYLGVCSGIAPAPTDGVIVTLVTDDVDAAYDRFTAAGVSTEAPPRLNERFGIYHFFARDPAGWRVEVQRFVDPPLPDL